APDAAVLPVRRAPSNSVTPMRIRYTDLCRAIARLLATLTVFSSLIPALMRIFALEPGGRSVTAEGLARGSASRRSISGRHPEIRTIAFPVGVRSAEQDTDRRP